MLASRSLIFRWLDEKIVFMQDKITKLEPEHNRYLQALPLALKVSEYVEECRKLEGIIASMNSNLSGISRSMRTLLSEFDESILNETISQLEELGKIVSGKQKRSKEKLRTLKNSHAKLLPSNLISQK